MLHDPFPTPAPRPPHDRGPSAGSGPSAPVGQFTLVDGEAYYQISAYHRMPPFLMNLTSDTDLWMFVTTGGGLTAGRTDPNGSLFPYETVDKLYDAHHHTGPITLLRVRRADGPEILWQPFSELPASDRHLERNLYKNTIGNRVLFEEIHHELELGFRYRWSASDDLGLVRTATLTNHGDAVVSVDIFDGLRNVLPHGVPLTLQQQSSCLVDAYKRVDCDPATRMGIFSLTSKIMDRAEVAEELRANAVWCHGLAAFQVALSSGAVDAFRRGQSVLPERVLTGRRGNYFAGSSLDLEPQERTKWHLVADVGRSHLELAALRVRLLESADLDRQIEDSLASTSENLLRTVASADGLQLTGHLEADANHLSNVLFNSMRGGVFVSGHDIPVADLTDFLRTRNRAVATRHEPWLSRLPASISLTELRSAAESAEDVDLQRLIHEYLPIYFGRRHGDPSRPWNRFTIRVRNPDGSRALRYEGNWRDIFQNWEALALSFPGFLPNFLAKFVNASTVDGFNPYRVTRDEIEWETENPADPWSNIGYWGDHQIAYLLKFLEALQRHSPVTLEHMLDQEIFCYADVPYRLEPYEQILENPNTTIVYDTELAARIEVRCEAMGTDGKLVLDARGSVYHVNMLEKLLVPVLSKLSNLVPDGGIWMNTQRPEWNDANNALVGKGASVVTLCYLRRYLQFLQRLLENRDAATSLSTEVVQWLRQLRSIFSRHRALRDSGTVPERDRKALLDALGRAFSEYRAEVYDRGFSGKQDLACSEIVSLCREVLPLLDHAILANRREDGLYHAYNLVEFGGDGTEVSLRPLPEMLEGQVAALSSGAVEPTEAVHLLSRLFQSRLFRSDQNSFLLYPERELPGFLEKNVLSEGSLRAVPLLKELVVEREPSIVSRDALGKYRFHADFGNADDVATALDRLAQTERWADAVARDRQAILDVFEETFDHASFTGRSGTMYAYEGLGCIYWHMVSKLLLAVQEIVLRSAREEQPLSVQRALVDAYYRIRSGLGFEKTVLDYGAFPTDPYSHTPAHTGAQQPGMTGKVKEEILTRFGELGVQVEDGIVSFRPVLLRRREFRDGPGVYRFYDIEGESQRLDVPAGALAFSFCGIPVVYSLCPEAAWTRVTERAGPTSTRSGDRLDLRHSRALLDRSGAIAGITVGVSERSLCEC